MKRAQQRPRRSPAPPPQKRSFLLRGIVHCATGHNPLRMQGALRKGEPTYYTCGYRTSYGDRAAEAVGHGKWQYVREDSLIEADRQLLRHADIRR